MFGHLNTHKISSLYSIQFGNKKVEQSTWKWKCCLYVLNYCCWIKDKKKYLDGLHSDWQLLHRCLQSEETIFSPWSYSKALALTFAIGRSHFFLWSNSKDGHSVNNDRFQKSNVFVQIVVEDEHKTSKKEQTSKKKK